MSVRKRLEKQDSIDVDFLIEKGAKVKEDQINEQKKYSFINLRISSDMLKDVEECVNDRIGISRNTWILEAINEKLKRSQD